MKTMDSMGLKMCRYQAELFTRSIDETECSSGVFIRRFMNSELAHRIDNSGGVFDSLDISDAINEIETQYGKCIYGKVKYSPNEMHWIGYLYRYWAYFSGMSSKQIYKIVKPGKLKQLYYPYHSLDPMQAIERIMEETDAAAFDFGNIERGVEILTKIRNRPQHP